MTISTGLVSVGATAVPLCVMPPGPCQVTISNTHATQTAYIGTSSAVTTSGGFAGFPVPAGSHPVTIEGYNGSAGAQLFAIASGASTPVGYIISTASGGTGL